MRTPCFRAGWAWIAMLLLWMAPVHAEEEQVTLNFVNADIDSVVKTVGLISGKNFVIDPRVKGTVNIVSSKPVPRALTYQIMLSALRLQGYSAIEGPGVIKIVPEADAKQNFSVTSAKSLSTSGDRIVTHVYPLQYESAAQLLPILRPLIGPNNTIAAYAHTNTLVITDYADNVRRINKIIDSIDQPSGGELVVIKLEYASALDLSQQLNRLMSEGMGAIAAPGAVAGEPGQRFLVSADVRTNSLLIRSDNPARVTRVRNLVAQMDTPSSASGNMHVVYLRNAEAGKLAETLRAILSGEARSSQPATPGAPPPPNAGGTPAPTGGGIVQADAASNSLIITAPDNVYNSLRAVIDKLDARRAQVFVEALIAEVTLDKAAEFGIQWQTKLDSGANHAVLGGVNFGSSGSNIVDLATGTTLPGKGFNLGVLQRFTIGGKEVIGLTALARALESDVNANILSTPNLLTMDNEEAKIVIGKNVPFITGSFTPSASVSGVSVNPFQTIERKDVGLTLKVRPQVAEGGTVKLQILQEVSSIQDTTNQAGIITNKRSIESTVLVDDGQTIVLGGLIQDDVQNGIEKVPGLGDIPILGNLFKYEKRNHVKTNLMVFLRPVVLRNSAASETLTGDRYDYIRNAQSAAQVTPHLILPNISAPLLPDLKSNQAGRAVEGTAP